VSATRVTGLERDASRSAWDLPQLLGLTDDVDALRELLAAWIEDCDPEVREMVRRQLSGRAKYFRPVTLFACHAAMEEPRHSEELLRAAAAVELIHNVSLIVDDILDRSRYRRGILALHCRYGFLPALMSAGYMGFAASRLVASDAYSVRLIAELMQRLGVAECVQWRLRRHPLGVEDWRALAGEDTGSMFEICARLGTRDDCLRKFGRLLGMLYHGCDDVADVRGTTALGGGSESDIVEGILTLPAAIAIRDPAAAVMFRNAGRDIYGEMAERQRAALPEAEAYLDTLQAEAEAEAIANAAHPERLLDLVRHTRTLSAA
jgi:geranylgeranyl diphosphate synthase type I